MFMKIDDVAGESVDSSHAGEIDVLSWSWGASQTGSSAVAGGSGAGKANVQDLTFGMHFEKSIPVLAGMLMAGTPFKQAQLTIRKAGTTPLEYIKVIMTTGIVSNVSFSGTPGSDFQAASVSLNFSAVEVHYTPQADDGTGAAEVVMGYDISANKAK
jgi:type VI secretion system secreted protein Hcp